MKRGNTWTARWKVSGKIISLSLHTSNRKEAELELARLSAPRNGKGGVRVTQCLFGGGGAVCIVGADKPVEEMRNAPMRKGERP